MPGPPPPPARPKMKKMGCGSRTFFLCSLGWDVAAMRVRQRPSGARESQLFGGRLITKIFPKIRKNATTTLAYYIVRICRKHM